ncbi:hypothetical protein IGI37_000992 [Enterococcus sp. AZ194]|uniref:TFIIB-type zinc finger domain-containing protein n=1 Tax=Enterococcus sp. AZ194 TaxID=2774629 RepID=UPI003F1EDEC1
MKKIICEQCGSNEFEKKAGLYVCKYCRTSFTIEEATRLSGEGRAHTRGEQLAKLKKAQEKAFDSSDFAAFITHSEQLILEDNEDHLSILGQIMAVALQTPLETLTIDRLITDSLTNWLDAPDEQIIQLKTRTIKLYDTFFYKLLVDQSRMFTSYPTEKLGDLLALNVQLFCDFPQTAFSKKIIGKQEIPALEQKRQHLIKRLFETMATDWSASFKKENTPPLSVSDSMAQNKIAQANSIRTFLKTVLADRITENYERFILYLRCGELVQVASSMQMIITDRKGEQLIPIYNGFTKADQEMANYLKTKKEIFSDLVIHRSWHVNSLEKQGIYTSLENLQEEFHSLGLFSGNRKKELLSQINTLKDQLRRPRTLDF